MTDTSDETEDLGEFVAEDASDSDWCDWDGGDICFPDGAQWFAHTIGAIAIRTTDKTGIVEVLVSQDEGQSYKWLDVTKLRAPAKLVAINGDKAK